MNTTTELANSALSYIGEAKISDINDTGSRAARVCKEFMDATISEVLRLFRWNCAIKRATLAQLSTAPAFGYERSFQLPVDFIRLLEVNGEEYQVTQKYYQIEASKKFLSNWELAEIRYIALIPVAEFDPLLAESIATKLATKIAIPLGANANLMATVTQQHDRAIRSAKLVDAIEGGNAQNGGIRKEFEKSDLLRSRYWGGRGTIGSGRTYLKFPRP